MEAFHRLQRKEQDEIKALIYNMATIKELKSDKVTWNLKNYNYGEIRPLPHRFFFFRIVGNCLVFFDYRLKKTGSFHDRVYKRINRKKVQYEKEFKKRLR